MLTEPAAPGNSGEGIPPLPAFRLQLAFEDILEQKIVG